MLVLSDFRADLPSELRQRILQRADGNPFFVEEVVRSLIQNGAVMPEEQTKNGQTQTVWRATANVDWQLPENLYALLTAHVDQLQQETRLTLQLAAVIGQTFYEQALAHLSDKNGIPTAALKSKLGELRRLN